MARTTKSLAERIADLRETIKVRQSERIQLTEQVRSPSEVRACVAAMVARWQEEATKRLRYSMIRLAGGDKNVDLGRAEVHEATPTRAPEAELGPLLTLVLGEAVVQERLCILLDAVPDSPDTPERLERLAAIVSELDELETEEERLICESEHAGEPILRRGDARPEIVLGRPEPVKFVRHPNLYGVQRQTVPVARIPSPYVGSSRD